MHRQVGQEAPFSHASRRSSLEIFEFISGHATHVRCTGSSGSVSCRRATQPEYAVSGSRARAGRLGEPPPALGATRALGTSPRQRHE